MKNITLPGAIVIGCCVVGIAVVASQLLKQSSIERQQEAEIAAQRATEYRAEQEELKKNEELTSARASCLGAAKLKLDKEVQLSKDFNRTHCDALVPDSIEQRACISVVAGDFNEAKANYETDQQECYDRYPATN
jgi:hypothetical protein